MPPFPPRPPLRRRTGRSAGVLTLSTLIALTGPALVPVEVGVPGAGSAVAGDLDERQDRNSRDLESAQEDLELTSTGLQRATARLVRAQSTLDAAERRLASTRARLTTAQVLDDQVQRELDAARAALQEARAELRLSLRRLEARRGRLGSLAASSYQTADTQLMRLTALFNAEDLSTVTVQLNTASNLLDKELTGLDRLRASEVLLTVGKDQVEEFKEQVAVRRAAAAENLREIESLEAEAQRETAEVAGLVEVAAGARAEAEKAKERDLAMLGELERERDRIGDLLRQRAAEARRRAAAARAAEEAAAREAARRQQEQRRQQRRSTSSRPAAPAAPAAPAGTGGVLGAPVDGYLTSSFGYRTHPIYGYRSFHDGVDFGAGRCGVPIRAAASGQVVSRYFQTAYGNRLIIDHGLIGGAGIATIYNHASSYTVSSGQNVSRGQVVGYVGDTGWSTGCHLHFTVLRNGSAVNPSGYL